MTQPRAEQQGQSCFPSSVIISRLSPVQWGSPQMPSTSPAHFSTDATPLFVFTTVQLRHDYSHPYTRPSIIALQQWTWAGLSEDSVTVHNGLMADAVREFTGTNTQTYAGQIKHTHTHTLHTIVTNDTGRSTNTATQVNAKNKWASTTVGYNMTTESQTGDFKWTVWCTQWL